MTDQDEKFRGLSVIPIFPLPLVLLPAEVLPLHIFEPRYRQMLKDISATDNRFGLNRFDPSAGFGDRPEIGSVGCVAEVREVQTLPDGRSNIVTVGRARYEIIGYRDPKDGYLVAEVEFFRDHPNKDRRLEAIAGKVLSVFRRIAKAAKELSGSNQPLADPGSGDPETLSFAVASAFNLDVDAKSELLATRDTLERLERLLVILESAVDRIEETANVRTVSMTNGHSKKKIDL
jgi:Lon protease-like protein